MLFAFPLSSYRTGLAFFSGSSIDVCLARIVPTSHADCLLLFLCALVSAEKALSILTPFIQLSPSPAPFQPLPPSRDSLPRVVSGFPNGTTPGDVWEYLRPAAIRELRPLGSPGPGASDGPSCESRYVNKDLQVEPALTSQS